ncbi:O-antigen ligase family protein [Phormidesmis priestleyi]
MKKDQSSVLYLGLIFVLMALSSLVIVEPAPVDLLIVVSFVLGFFSFFRSSLTLAIPTTFLLVFALSNLISTFVVEDVTRGLYFLSIRVYFIVSWLLFVGVTRHFGAKAVKTIFSGYIFASILAIALGFLAFFHILNWDFLTFADRPKGLFKDPNVFGPFLIPVVLYAALEFESSKSKNKLGKLGWAALFLLASIGSAFSFSRAAWLNYTISISSYVVLRLLTASSTRTAIRRGSTYISLLLLLLTVFGGLLVAQPNTAEFFTQRSAYQAYDNLRFGIQEVAVNDALSSFVGIGPGQAEVVYDYATHSSYVRILVENSWLGAIGFFGFVLLTLNRSFRMVLKPRSSNQGLFIVFTAALLGILANSFFIDTVHWRHFWLLLALPWGNYSLSSSTDTPNCLVDAESVLTLVD